MHADGLAAVGVQPPANSAGCTPTAARPAVQIRTITHINYQTVSVYTDFLQWLFAIMTVRSHLYAQKTIS